MKKEDAIALIKSLSNANGISGFEDEVVSLVQSSCADVGPMKKDHILNVAISRKENTGNKPVVMLDAHSDEVGFIVQAIKPNGTLKFLPVGGWIDSNVAASRVRIRNNQGEYISGVVASMPPHFMSAADKGKPVSIDNMVIDIGSTSYEETVNDFQISMAAPIVPDVECRYYEDKDLFFGKAFDCRIGVACMIDTLKSCIDEALNVDVIASLSAQEEIGTRGARVAVQNIQPDLAIVFEGCPADDTFTEPYMIQSALRKGPMLRHFDVSMITNPRFQRYALDLARKYNIPVQESVRKGGGTDGAPINAYRNGVPAIVIGIPVRYAHTHYGYITYEDFQAGKDLALAILRDINAATIAAF